MKTIKFTDEELSLLRQMYQDELSNAEKYIERIKSVMNKLGTTMDEVTEEEPVVKRRGPRPRVKEIVPKVGKKRGRKPRSEAVSDIVSSLPSARIDTEPKIPKKRGPKPKAVSVESQVPKKAGRPKSIPTEGDTPLIIANEPKRRGRKPRIAVGNTNEPEQISAPKEEKRIVKRRSPYRKTRKWRGVRLTSWQKPLKWKDTEEEPMEETTSFDEPIVPPVQETNIPTTEEPKI